MTGSINMGNKLSINLTEQQFTDWLIALRSGNYKQGKLVLRDYSEQFCCLGVLCETIKIPRHDDGYQFSEQDGGFSATNFKPYLGDVHRGAPGGHHTRLNAQLALLNDSEGWSFDRIADFLEEKYEPAKVDA